MLSFVNAKALRPLKIVVNSGNGAAGPTFDAIAGQLLERSAPLEFVRVHHAPDAAFSNGIPNLLLQENHSATADVVKAEKADFGVAFDSDFDRSFFFDETGQFDPGEYVVGLLESIFLEKEVGAKIVHEPRVIWNTQDSVACKGGVTVPSKTGHAFIKQTIRSCEAVYGGEMSAHRYFRDFAFCNSGLIPWLLIAELVSRSRCPLGDWVKDRYAAFSSSGEINFTVADAGKAIENVLSAYRAAALSLDETDGLSLAFNDWRLNLRHSNTEPLVRLNVEGRGNSGVPQAHVSAIVNLLGDTKNSPQK